MAYLQGAVNNVNPASRTEQVGIWIQKGGAITLDVDVGYVFKWVRVTSAGDINVLGIDGETILIPGVQVAEMIPVWGTKILTSGTTASGIFAYTGE